MAERLKYFSFHKKLDFERGFCENMQIREDGIFTENSSYNSKSVFFSRLLDAGEEQLMWHRMTLETEGRDAVFRISLYASDTPEMQADGQRLRADEILKSEEFSAEKKMEYFLPFLKKRVAGSRDLLLHEVKGRYLWYVIEIFSQGRAGYGDSGNEFGIRQVMVYFPGQSWLKYLPELYEEADGENGFLRRYLGIFQSIYEDVSYAVSSVPKELWVDLAEQDFLHFLASLLDWKDTHVWEEEKLKILLNHAVWLYRMRGTIQAVSWIVELYTGEKPYVLEYHDIRAFCKDMKKEALYVKLYGNDPYVFNIFLKETAVPTEKEYKTILRILDEVRPAQMQIRLVVLKSYIFLDEHSYLGVNSVLGQYRDVTLDGVLAVPFAVIGK